MSLQYRWKTEIEMFGRENDELAVQVSSVGVSHDEAR